MIVVLYATVVWGKTAMRAQLDKLTALSAVESAVCVLGADDMPT